jgi:hypothetical protein
MAEDQRAKRYSIGREPNHSAPENAASWTVISAILTAYGAAGYSDLVAAVSQHRHPSGGKGFVDYCIRSGWLVAVN